MVRRFLLPLLGLALIATEAATAQTLPTAQASTNKEIRRAGRTLTAREKRAAAAQAAAAEAQVAAQAKTAANQAATASTNWSGWSNDPHDFMQGDPITHRPVMNVSIAPGMPLNQVTSGVTTDYDGHPLRPATNTTLATAR